MRLKPTLKFILSLLLSAMPNLVQAEMKIGAILHLTGDQAMQGSAFREGIELAAAQINSKSGCGGNQLKIIFEDSQLKPKQAHAAAKKLLEVDSISAGINASFLEVMANGQEFEKAQVPVITLWDSAPQIEDLGEYIFGIGIWTPSAGQVSAQFARHNLNGQTAVIINTQNEWSESVAKFFKEEFEKLGGRVLESFALTPATVDFRTPVTRALKLNPDILYTPITDNLVAFYRQLKQLHNKAHVVTSDIIAAAHIAEDPKSFDGIYQSQAQDPEGSSAIHLSQEYLKHFGRPANQLLLTAWGYDAVHMICAAVEAKDMAPKNIMAELYKVKNFKGASGMISINSKGSAAVSEKIFSIKDSRFSLVPVRLKD